MVKSGPTYRVKSREIPLSAHWPCAIIDRATAGGVGRFHNRKGAINVPCNDLNSWIIPAEDRRGFLSFSAYFSPLFAVLFHPLNSALSFSLSRFNQRKSLTGMPPFRSWNEGRLMKFRDVRVSFNFEVEQFHDTRTGRTIDLSAKKKRESRSLR